MANGFRPNFRGLLFTSYTISGNVTSTDADPLSFNVYKDGLGTKIIEVDFPRSSAGWATIRGTLNAYVNPNDVSPQWIGIQSVGDSVGGQVTQFSWVLEGEYLWG